MLKVVIIDYLRNSQRNQCWPEFSEFINQMKGIATSVDLEQKLFIQQRITLLELFIAQSSFNSSFGLIHSNFMNSILPGHLVIVDLFDSFLSFSHVNSIFQILIRKFQLITLLPENTQKFLAIENCEKCMKNNFNDHLSINLSKLAELNSFNSIRLFIGSNNLSSIPSRILEYSSLTILDRCSRINSDSHSDSNFHSHSDSLELKNLKFLQSRFNFHSNWIDRISQISIDTTIAISPQGNIRQFASANYFPLELRSRLTQSQSNNGRK